MPGKYFCAIVIVTLFSCGSSMALQTQLKDDSSRGLCWHSKELDSSREKILLWGRTGGDPGIATYLFFQPDQKTGVITFQNSEAEGTFSIVRELFLMVK